MPKHLYWIDDEQKTRSRHAPDGASKKHLEKGLNVELKVKDLASFQDFEQLIENLREDQCYGVLMDYQLIKVGANRGTEYGTTWAAHLRASKPRIPVVGLSSEKESSIPRFRIENFLAFFKRGELISDPPIGQLRALFEGYHSIWDSRQKQSHLSGLDLMIQFLTAPATIEDLLRSAIPPALRGEWDTETPHTAARWIWHEFQGRTGFLFDELEAATYLGITEDAFVQFTSNKHLKAAQYKGAMACDARPRWWASLMRDAAERVIKNAFVGPTSQARDQLLTALKVPAEKQQEMHAQPYSRKKGGLIPDCVAFRDGYSKNQGKLEARVPTLLRDTIVDEVDANPPLGFQAPRHFKLNAES